jgi:hypothetical protein
MMKNTALACLLALAFAGCSSPTTGGRAEPVLEGHFGDVADFSGTPELSEAYYWPGQTYVDVRTRGDGWAVMTGLTFEGRLGEGNLAPGSVVHVDDPFTWESFPEVTMLGCAGPADDSWTTDCSPEEIVVQIDQGSREGTLLLSYDATFPGDCTGGGPIDGEEPPIVFPGEPEDGGDAPGDGSLPGDDLEPPPSEPAGPISTIDEPQVIHGVIEIAIADIVEDGDFGGPVGVEPLPAPADEGY